MEEDLLKEKLQVATFELRRLEKDGKPELIAAQLAFYQTLSKTLQGVRKEKAKRDKDW